MRLAMSRIPDKTTAAEISLGPCRVKMSTPTELMEISVVLVVDPPSIREAKGGERRVRAPNTLSLW